MKSSLKRLGIVAVATMVGIGAVTNTALAVSSTEVLKDVKRAAAQAGEEQSVGNLEVVKDGEWIATKTYGVSLVVPAGKITNNAEGTIVQGEGDSDLVFQQVGDDSYRTSIHIAKPSDPERFPFDVLGAERLEQQVDGTVQIFGAEDQLIAEVDAPWAKDANGNDVPTQYEIDGTTIVQQVSRSASNVAYPVIADPKWRCKICGHFVKRVKKGAHVAANVFYHNPLQVTMGGVGGYALGVTLCGPYAPICLAGGTLLGAGAVIESKR